jgi:hypothetical protein
MRQTLETHREIPNLSISIEDTNEKVFLPYELLNFYLMTANA